VTFGRHRRSASRGVQVYHRTLFPKHLACPANLYANVQVCVKLRGIHIVIWISAMPALLTIRDAAERLQVTPRTLKYYEERGLVTPTRSEGRYRLYSEQDLELFARILRLRSLGFSLQGIVEMLKRPMETQGEGRTGYSASSLREIEAALSQQIEAVDARIAAVRRELKEAQAVRSELAGDLDYLRRRIAGESKETLLQERMAARKPRKDIDE
jgi:DNA-binding transcriptional MerR regulator